MKLNCRVLNVNYRLLCYNCLYIFGILRYKSTDISFFSLLFDRYMCSFKTYFTVLKFKQRNMRAVLILLIFAFLDNSNAMTRAQVKKTMTVMKNQCMPKTGVTEDKVGKIEQGVFIAEHNVMCYIACVYKTIQVMKNDRLDKDLIWKQVDILYPPEMRGPTKKAISQCLPLQDQYSDTCEGVFHSTKCLYETDPANFIFP
ncbi:general odorant-binding protein lush isoform X1 [Manduca sexta]|uniref:general odorant-binding protein lush isoform X1 n=1 Tax=Manduca sexta TaxID=7130 RepID=UPI00188F6922|nr:general odorant-binding protein lush isoform X1 [Manduca sexta]